MAAPKRALLLINPESRLGLEQDITDGLSVLREQGITIDEVLLDRDTDYCEMIRSRAEKYDLLIAGGGDGTLNRMADALVSGNLPLGVLPLGTGNDLARTLGIPFQTEAACRVIAAGSLKKIDLGRVNGRFFFNVASIGFSTEVVEHLDKEAKKRWGTLAYFQAIFRALRRGFHKNRSFRAAIAAGDRKLEVKSIQIGVGNGRYYGGGLVVAEDSAIDDHELVLYTIKPQSLLELIRMIPSFITGRHVAYDRVTLLRGTSFEVHTERPMPIDTDGELTRQTPGYFDILPDALEVFTPAAPDKSIMQEYEHANP